MDLPPGAEYRNGQLVRVVPRTAADGSTREEVRPVSLDPIEAKAKRIDYYHPLLKTWLREGYKLVTDRSVESRMQDNTTAVAVHEEDRPQESEEE